MARRSASASAVAVAVALLVVAQAAAAFVVPEVVLMRVKRHPDPMRSFSFSGFDPNGQMAAFTGMAGYPMFGNGYGPPPASPYHQGPPPAQDSYGQSTQDSYGPPPSGAEQPQQPAAADPNPLKLQQVGGGVASFNQRPQEYGPRPADSNEQNNSVEQTDSKKKQYKGRDGPSSNAEASFNAWFPIMFGVFPNGAGGQSGNTAVTRGNNQGQGQQDQAAPGNANSNPGNNNGYERLSGGGTTVIANSVSNGRHGVATSHAIAYGNPRSSSSSSQK